MLSSKSCLFVYQWKLNVFAFATNASTTLKTQSIYLFNVHSSFIRSFISLHMCVCVFAIVCAGASNVGAFNQLLLDKYKYV